MKKELNPAVAIGAVVVILIGIVVYFWQANDSRTLPSIRRGTVQRPGGVSSAAEPAPKGGAKGD